VDVGGADVLDGCGAEVGEQGEGPLPELAGLVVVAEGVVGVCQAVEGAYLVAALAEFAGQVEGGSVGAEGLLGVACCRAGAAEPQVGFELKTRNLLPSARPGGRLASSLPMI
jgi:hypothetical protein